MNKIIILFVSACLMVGCNTKERIANKDILFNNLDTTINPADDFFAYAHGGWIKNNPIPEDQSSWGIANVVIEENLQRLRTIADKAGAAKAPKGSPEQMIGDFWTLSMDSAKIEKEGIAPLQPYLDKVNNIKDLKSLLEVVTAFKKIGSSTLFSSYVGRDDKNSNVTIYCLNQGGLGLPDREYYFKQDSSTNNIREKYLAYIQKMLKMSGTDDKTAAISAANILTLETGIARASRKLEDLRDPYANYNKRAVAELKKMTKNLDWNLFFEISGVKNIDSVIVGQPEFFTALDKLLVTVPIDHWKAYIRFNLINDFAETLPKQYGETAFEFNKLFSGAKKRKARWKRSMNVMENVMGELLGQLYVKEYFSEKTKKRYEALTEEIRTALKERIASLTWMSDTTKQKAYAKLAAMKKKVGYPDKWIDFSAMKIDRSSYLNNLINANLWQYQYNINKLGKPADKDEWFMYPQTYNAGYSPLNNEIQLPAGIFTVPGLRDEELDDALVYGYTGASTIGHEITHGFDDNGRQYDDKGNLKNWWTKADEDAFKKQADLMVKQFNEYEPVKGYFINGNATLGENIADLGGVLLGLEAFKKTKQYKEAKPINGLTPLQRYFLGYALGWLGHMRDESLRNQILTDVHAPAKYRVNGPFADVDQFYNLFKVQPGHKMYRADSLRVRIW